MNNNGLLLIFSGPSGAGKGTVLKELLNGNDNMKLSVSATTRTPREGECHGVHYFFMTKEEFEEQIANGQMLEHAEYCGKYYGTPSSQIMDWIEEGRDVVLEIEVQGARQIKEKRPDCVSIFVLPPSLEELEKRFNLSKYHLVKIFKKAFSYSPIQYHQIIRIQKAKEMIQYSNKSLTQIAEELGFTSINAFSRAFKNTDGVYPSYYRRNS